MTDKPSRIDRFVKVRGQVHLARDYATFLERSFWHSQERWDAIAAFGPGIHTLLHKALLDSLVLCLRRLLDEPGSDKKRTLSFLGFIQSIRDDEPTHAAGLTASLDALETTVRALRNQVPQLKTWRDKLIAHLDELAVLAPLTDIRYTIDELLHTVQGAETALNQAGSLVFSNCTPEAPDRSIATEIEGFMMTLLSASAVSSPNAER
ncbi:MAG: hypothetical protein IT438_04090 [Phycisphaerales bacterium]|nr:hypothetical protein [Phycisphaerales bacterium]